MSAELTIKGDIEVLRLEPGDVIVATIEVPITHDMADALSRDLTERFPNNEVLLIPQGVRLSVQRKEVA